MCGYQAPLQQRALNAAYNRRPPDVHKRTEEVSQDALVASPCQPVRTIKGRPAELFPPKGANGASMAAGYQWSSLRE